MKSLKKFLFLKNKMEFIYSWLRDNMDVIQNFKEIEDIVSTVRDSGDVYFVPAFSGLYAPYWNQEARG